MPKIQLIRRDGKVIELDATDVAFDVQRGVQVWPIPVFGVRAALDLNTNVMSIRVSGVLTDDSETTGSNGAAAVLDLSAPTGLYDSWFKQQQAIGNSTISAIVTALHGKEFLFRSSTQIASGSGEDIVLRFYASALPSATVATRSIIPVNLTGSILNTEDIADAIVSALSGATIKEDGSNVSFTTAFTVTQAAGQKSNSGVHQGAGTLTGEKITITNRTLSANGNTPLSKRGDATVSGSQDWTGSFSASTAFTGGVSGSRLSKGDKVQDLLNMTVNASPGGGLISPQSFTGDLIEMPDSLSSFDVGKLLRIDQAENVKKYIVGLRVPYESTVTATGFEEVTRQFTIPTGPGTNTSAESNTVSFDPVDVISGEAVRPNPFLRQGVAISGVVTQFSPKYAAGDSVWTYELGFSAVEQLLGI